MAEIDPTTEAERYLLDGGNSPYLEYIDSVPPFILTVEKEKMSFGEDELLAMSRIQEEQECHIYDADLCLDQSLDSGSQRNAEDDDELLSLESESMDQPRSIPTGSCDSLQFPFESHPSFPNIIKRRNDTDDKTSGTSSQTYSQPSLENSSQSTASPYRTSPPTIVPQVSDSNQYIPGPLLYKDMLSRQDDNELKLTVRPFVYSAIGSLENLTQHSFGSFQSKFLHMANRTKHTEQKSSDPDSTKINKRKKKKSPKGKTKSLTNEIHNISQDPNIATDIRHTSDPLPEGSSAEHKQSIIKSNSDGAISDELKELSERANRVNKISKKRHQKKKKVTINEKGNQIQNVELFRPSCDAYTPRMKRGMDIKFKPTEERGHVKEMTGTMGTLQRPNHQDALRRVAMIIHQHIIKIENRFQAGVAGLEKADLFDPAMREIFAEEKFASPRYKCSVVKIPMARPGVICGMRKIKIECEVPSEKDIYDFALQLFNSVQLSSECSIICLIYVERLMEIARVPLMANTWRPIFMCGLLLASKVWQDWSSWNVEFASVYPQFSLGAVNRLESQFLKMVKWDLYISSSLYAKYYFALRSLLEKQAFRSRYNRMIGYIGNPDGDDINISKRTEVVKLNALSQLSTSM